MTEKGDNSESPQFDSDSDLEDSNNRLRTCDNIPEKCSDTSKDDRLADTSYSSFTSCDTSEKYDDYTVNINTSHPQKEKLNKHLQDLVDDKTKCETVDHNFDVANIIEDVLQESQLLSDDPNEPDIIRSTKTRTPPNTLQVSSQAITVILPPSGENTDKVQTEQKPAFLEPVAPPRKKKKLKLSTSGVHGSTENLVRTKLYLKNILRQGVIT